VDTLRIESFSISHLEKRLDNITTELRCARITGNAKQVSATGDLNVETAFDLSQVLIELSAKIGETVIVGRLQDEVPGYLYGVQGLAVRPLKTVDTSANAVLIVALD